MHEHVEPAGDGRRRACSRATRSSKGLDRKPWVKSSLAPGSKVVTRYYEQAGLQQHLDALGFNTVGYGCTTCIGNSGPLADEISGAITEGDLVVCSVLSGNRNFEARIHPEVKANYLASPPLVVAYSLAGRMDIDFEHEPIGTGSGGEDVFLRDIWPSAGEIGDTIASSVRAEQFAETYADVFTGDEAWRALPVPAGELFAWEPDSTYVRQPPYFEGMTREPAPVGDIEGARVLVWLGDSVTTDHISPAGAIKLDSPAGEYLIEHGVERKDFNTYGARRGNHEVMIRGTFANVRLRNQLVPGSEGTWTEHMPSGEQMTIYAASQRYLAEGTPTIVLAGTEYGSGLVARLGGEGAEPARGQGGDRRVVRAHPPLEPPDDGRAAAAVPGRRDPGDARAHGPRVVLDRGRRERRGRGGDRARRRQGVPRARPPRHAARARVLPARRHPSVRDPPAARRAPDVQGAAARRRHRARRAPARRRSPSDVRAAARLPLLAKDTLKETLGEPLGVTARAASQRLGTAVFELLAVIVHELLEHGVSLIVEANFTPDRRSSPRSRRAASRRFTSPPRRRRSARGCSIAARGRHPVHYDQRSGERDRRPRGRRRMGSAAASGRAPAHRHDRTDSPPTCRRCSPTPWRAAT